MNNFVFEVKIILGLESTMLDGRLASQTEKLRMNEQAKALQGQM